MSAEVVPLLGPDPQGAASKNSMRIIAAELASQGFAVFPLRINDKRPLVEGWQTVATEDAFRIIETWPEAGYGVGISTDNLVVLDADVGKGGLEAIAALNLPVTRTVRTAGGGRHYYFKPPPGLIFQTRGCRVKRNGEQVPAIVGAWGVDVRAKGGLVVAPGNVINGKAYVLEVDAPIAELPPHLVERLRIAPKKDRLAGVAVVDLDTPWAIDRARQYLEKDAPTGVPQGTRGWTAYQVAADLGDFGVSCETALEMMGPWNDEHGGAQEEDKLQEAVEHSYRFRQNPIGCKHPARALSAIQQAPGGIVTASIVRPASPPKPLSSYPDKRMEFTWWPYIPAGAMTLLGGMGGVGKGLISAALASIITRGDTFPCGREKAKRGRVLWGETEDDISRVLKPRLRAAGADLDRIDVVEARDFPALDLRNYIVANDIGLIVLSPMASYLPKLDDANSELKVRAALQVLQDAIEDTGCALLGLMHLNKKSDVDAIQRLLGSVAFGNFVRAVLLAQKEDQETGQGRIVHAKFNNSYKGDDLIYTPPPRNADKRTQDIAVAWSRAGTNIDANSLFERKRKKESAGAGDFLVAYLRANGATAKETVVAAAEEEGFTRAAIEKAHQRDRRCHSMQEGFGKKAVWWIEPA
jgi:hypothetical protein